MKKDKYLSDIPICACVFVMGFILLFDTNFDLVENVFGVFLVLLSTVWAWGIYSLQKEDEDK